jgi:hypothetical protein
MDLLLWTQMVPNQSVGMALRMRTRMESHWDAARLSLLVRLRVTWIPAHEEMGDGEKAQQQRLEQIGHWQCLQILPHCWARRSNAPSVGR